MIYYLVFILGIMLASFKKDKVAAKIFTAILIAFTVFRYGFGADYFSYGALYSFSPHNVAEVLSKPSAEPEIGFRIIMAAFKSLGLQYQTFLAIWGIISIFYLYKIAEKHTKNPALAMVIFYACYYFVWTLSALRQGLVLVIGIYYLLEAVNDKNKTLKFVVITLLLSLLHSSSFLLLVLFATTKINLTKKNLIVFLAIAIGFNLLPMNAIIAKLTPYIPLLDNMSAYIGSSLTIRTFFGFNTIARIAFLIMAFALYDIYCEESPFNKKIMNMYIISFAIYFLFKFSELTAARLAIYGKILDIIILSNLVFMLKKKENKMLYVLFLFSLLTLYFFKELNTMVSQASLINPNDFFVPYVNIFNKNFYVFDNSWQFYIR